MLKLGDSADSNAKWMAEQNTFGYINLRNPMKSNGIMKYMVSIIYMGFYENA